MKIILDKKVWVYIIVLFVISYIVQLIIILTGGESSHLFNVLAPLLMYFPGIGAIIYLIKTKEDLRYINWNIGNPFYLFLSLLIPALLTLINIILIENIGWGVNTFFEWEGGTITILKGSFLLGIGNQSIPWFLLNFLLTTVAYALITALFTLGEEVGWRGFLQKKLLEQNSLFTSIICLGLLWGFWHFPMIINGYNYPDYPVLGAFLFFPLTTIFASFLLAYLTINGKSIWGAVLAHGVVNSIFTIVEAMDFGIYKLQANCLILAIWGLVAILAYRATLKNF